MKDYPIEYDDHFLVFVSLETKLIFEEQDQKILKGLNCFYMNTVKTTLLPLLVMVFASKSVRAQDHTKTRRDGSSSQIERRIEDSKSPYKKLYTTTDYRSAEEKFDAKFGAISKEPILELLYKNIVKSSLAASRKAEHRSAMLDLVYQNLIKTSLSASSGKSNNYTAIGDAVYQNVITSSLVKSIKKEYHTSLLDELYKKVFEVPVFTLKKKEQYSTLQKFIVENARINENIVALSNKIAVLQKTNLNGFSTMSEKIFQKSIVRGGIDSRFHEGTQYQRQYDPNQEPQISRVEYQRQLRTLYIKRSLQFVALAALIVAMRYFVLHIKELSTDFQMPEKLLILDRKYNAMLKNPALFQAYLNNARDIFRNEGMRPPEQPDGIRLPGKKPLKPKD